MGYFDKILKRAEGVLSTSDHEKLGAYLGDAESQKMMGYNSYQCKDYIKAREWSLKAAEKGDRAAMRILGEIYYNGFGVRTDYGESAKWYKKAADKGNRIAQCALGMMYEMGRGVEQDNDKAEDFYRMAAEEDYTEAQYRLAELLRWHSRTTEARKWYEKAAANGQKEAAEALEEMNEIF